MNILITGSSGLIGTALSHSLSAAGHTIYPLLRHQSGSGSFSWSPSQGRIELSPSIPIDAVIHLAGASLSRGRWTEKRKKEILESQVNGTKLLSEYLATLEHKPQVFISASAIGFYGDTGDELLDESGQPGSGFPSHVCQQWEEAAEAASRAGIRTVAIRTGLVLSPAGGFLKKMMFPFAFGLGGKVGSGRQYISWVHIADMVNMIRFIIEEESLSGPVNLVSPNPVTNAEFTRSLGRVMHRPAFMTIPAFLVTSLFGEMAEDLLLSGGRVIPGELSKTGYQFIHTNLEQALRDILPKHN